MTNDKSSRLKILLFIMAGASKENISKQMIQITNSQNAERGSDREDKSRKMAQFFSEQLKNFFPGKISASRGILQCYIGNCTSFEDCRQDLELYLLLSRLQLFWLFSPNPATVAIIQQHCQEIQIYYRKAAK